MASQGVFRTARGHQEKSFQSTFFFLQRQELNLCLQQTVSLLYLKLDRSDIFLLSHIKVDVFRSL